jgi:hypothetical protein
VAAAVSQLPHDYPTGWCFHHEQVHGPMEWSDGCQSPEDDEFTRQYQRFQQGWEAVEASEPVDGVLVEAPPPDAR